MCLESTTPTLTDCVYVVSTTVDALFDREQEDTTSDPAIVSRILL